LTLTIGLSLPLTAGPTAMGREIESGLRLFAADTNAAAGIRIGGIRHEVNVRCIDDRGEPARCAEIYRSLCFGDRVDLLFGPYTGAMLRVAAPIADEARMVLVNHGGADDDIPGGRGGMLVSVAASAGDYLRSFARLLASLKMLRKRLAIISAPTRFARAVADGLEDAAGERAARWHGVRLKLKYRGTIDPDDPPEMLMSALRRNRINALVSAGGIAHDIAVMKLAIRSQLYIPALACVAAGLHQFGREMGADADGIVGASQWEADVATRPLLGPDAPEFARRMRAFAPNLSCEYPAARIYGAGLVSVAAVEAAASGSKTPATSIDQISLRAAFSALRTTTTFGDFAIDPDGRQTAHRMLLVQWHQGRKVVIDPAPPEQTGAVEFPSGLRMLLASLHILSPGRENQRRRGGEQDEDRKNNDRNEDEDRT